MTVRARRLWLALAIIAAATFVGTPASADTNFDVIDTGATVHMTNTGAGWWTPIVHHNGATYVAYIDQDLNTVVAKQDASGSWTSAIVGTDTTFDYGHTQPSISIDGDGYIHVFYNMHNDPITYKRSNQPESVTGGFTNRASEFPVIGPSGGFTYPSLAVAPNGDLYQFIRNSGYYCELYRWNDATNNWLAIERMNRADDFSCYPIALTVDSAGDVHLSFTWTERFPGANKHVGSYARYRPSNDTFYQADGTVQPLPVTPANADAFQPMRTDETWSHVGVRLGAMTVDANNRPIHAYSYSLDGTNSGLELRAARWNGSQWVRSTVLPNHGEQNRAWIGSSGNTIRYYYAANNEVHLRTSTNGGASWGATEQLTDGLMQQAQTLAGYSDAGTDYLYLNDRVSGQGGPLYVGVVNGGESPDGNIAPLADLSADSTQAGFSPAFAVDGIKDDNASRWLSENTPEPHWLELSWGPAKTIDNVKVWSGQMVAPGWQIRGYRMEYWNGSSWVNIPGASVVDNTKDGFNGQFNNLTFEPVTTSKVRMWITDAVDQGTRTNARLLEIEVWGN